MYSQGCLELIVTPGQNGGLGMTRPEISAELVAAYRSTEYCVRPVAGFGMGFVCPFILRVDRYSAPLSQLFSASGHRCAAFITACNPFSLPRSPEANHAACGRLRDALIGCVSHPGQIIEGEGSDPSRVWPGEESFLVLGLDIETSRALGNKFEQNAIVWTGPDAVPRLILLR
jgi:hypothetical protein